MLFANRNGFFYVLDRTNGRMILAKPFVTQTWAKEISPEGRPILLPGYMPTRRDENVSRSRRRHELLFSVGRSGAAPFLRERARDVRHLLLLERAI